MVLAAQLSTFPSISTRLIERRDGPLQVGQADGVACRTVEMFDAFGLSDKLMREAYWVNETAFWRPSSEDRSKIVRTGRVQDTEDGLSEFPHLIVNQARLLEYLLDYMRKSPTRLTPEYGLELLTLKVESEGDHPVVVTLRNLDTGADTSIRAKYVVGCDGARSRVRDAIGAMPRGDFANHAWGVVDMLAVPTSRISGSRPRSNPPTKATSSSSRVKAATWCGSMSTSARSTRTIAKRFV
jgi:phenol 2-monooxygenase